MSRLLVRHLKHKKPENNLVSNFKNIAFTPVELVRVKYNSVYSCESGSPIKRLAYHAVKRGHVTCSGAIVRMADDYYDAVIGKSQDYWGTWTRINLTSYYQINVYLNGKFSAKFLFENKPFSLNQGNCNYLECGTIKGGPCDGDQLWGIGIHEADNQEGCASSGFRANTALVRRIWVTGKCIARCSLGWSITSWLPPVNNFGSVGWKKGELN